MRGPRVLTDALAVTIAAQAGVAPVLVFVFGGVPLASVPANVLVAPVAAGVMVWGVGAGLVAGVSGPGGAAVLHWPTRVMIAWIGAVAHWGATMPLGEIEARHLAVLVLGVVVVVAGARGRASGLPATVARTGGFALIAVALLMPMLVLRSPPDGPMSVGSGAVLWRSRGRALLELDGRSRIEDVLEGLRRAGVRRLDLVVVRTASSSTTSTIETLRRWGAVGPVLTPSGSTIADATEVTDVVELDVGALRATVTPEPARLVVDVARGPPV
jgi:competence protein ComEC